MANAHKKQPFQKIIKEAGELEKTNKVLSKAFKKEKPIKLTFYNGPRKPIITFLNTPTIPS